MNTANGLTSKSCPKTPKGPGVNRTPLAEGVGFEPTIQLPVWPIRNRLASTTHPTLSLLRHFFAGLPSERCIEKIEAGLDIRTHAVVGRDFADVSPVDGVIVGARKQRLSVAVDVLPVE